MTDVLPVLIAAFAADLAGTDNAQEVRPDILLKPWSRETPNLLATLAG